MLTINGQHILSYSRIADELINKTFVKIPQINADRTTVHFEQCHSAVTPMVEFNIPQLLPYNYVL